MSRAEATLAGGADARIEVRTRKEPGVDDFAFMLAAAKKVRGGRFINRRATGDKFWAYPLSIDTCLELRAVFGNALLVSEDLAEWYHEAKVDAGRQAALAATDDAALANVPERFANWLRGYQRAGAAWIANGYRGAGLVADKPGVGKTPETLAAILEADVQGPVLVVCPRSSVKSVWGVEARRHLDGVPVYLCRGNRERRERMLALFAKHMTRDPNRLRIVVVVAEMLRVKLGNPCYTMQEVIGEDGIRRTVPKNKISGMCPQFQRNPGLLECPIHVQVPPAKDATKTELKKHLVPVGFEYQQLFNHLLLKGGWSWIILDESHKLLGSLTVAKANLMGRALRLLPERPDRRRYALSGTPFGKGGRIQGMFGTLHWLWPDEYTSFWKWAADVLEIEEKRIDRYGNTAKHIVGPKGLRANATPGEEVESWERFLISLGPRILRRTKEEVLSELPPKTYAEQLCEMTPAQRKQYDELVEYAEIKTPGGPIMANGHLALRTRERQIANGQITKGPAGKAQFTQDSGKLDRLWENLDARGIIDGLPGERLVVASEFGEFLDAIQAMLCRNKVAHLRIDGQVSDKRREQIMERWQGNLGNERVMLVQTKAAGISINLDAADEMHIMDEDPDPGVNEQLEDRIHRASRIHKVIIFYYRTEGTIDYKAAHDVEFRRRLQHAVLDGRRGAEDMRKLISEAS